MSALKWWLKKNQKKTHNFSSYSIRSNRVGFVSSIPLPHLREENKKHTRHCTDMKTRWRVWLLHILSFLCSNKVAKFIKDLGVSLVKFNLYKLNIYFIHSIVKRIANIRRGYSEGVKIFRLTNFSKNKGTRNHERSERKICENIFPSLNNIWPFFVKFFLCMCK